MSLRIHLVSEHASPLALLGGVDAGGQNVHVAALACGLARLGAEVVVHTRRDDPALERTVPFAPGVVVDHVDAGPPEPIPKDALAPHMGAFADDLVRQWSRSRPDVVHAHFWMSGLAATSAADRLGIPVALTYHALGIEKLAHQGPADTSPAGRLEAEEWLARAVDHVVATTAQERRRLLAMGAPPSRVTVVPCGVDLEHFRPHGPTWPPAAGRARLVCVSRLVPRKGIADVVTALAELPDAELLVAGGPPAAMLGDDPEAVRLRALAERHGVADRVQLLGAVERRDVPALLRAADVVCCTPWYEPFGLVAVEAMACGVPVVASAVGGLAETVRDGTTGRLVPPRRPEAVAAAVRWVLDRPDRAASMSAAAVRRAEGYGWDHVAQRTARLLVDLVRDGHAVGAPTGGVQ
ncbi:MAG TPA: glycosyltransferase [Promicromonospora sp.]|nr:glycosyltransferase [Promicromonospora sp.]